MSEQQKPVGDEPRPAKKRKRVIAKHLTVARHVARGKTLQQAGEAAGYPPKTARGSAWKAMETVRLRAPEVFHQRGLTLESLADDVNRLRKAKETKFFAHKGIVLDTREVEALSVQISAVDMGLRTFGAYREGEDAAGKGQDQAAGNTVCLVVCNERAAASLARLFATRSPVGPIIDVDAAVDQNLG
jgi:hypothetical protein